MGFAVRLFDDLHRTRRPDLDPAPRTKPRVDEPLRRALLDPKKDAPVLPRPIDPNATADARRRFRDDLAARFIRARLDDPNGSNGPNGPKGRVTEAIAGAIAKSARTRPPGEPFQPIARDKLDRIMEEVDRTNDLSKLDKVDNFRQTLTPEMQAEYDRQLEALRNDPRITFDYRDGAKESVAERDLALRGMLAATFGNPDLLNRTLDNSTAEDGKVHVTVFPSSFDLAPFYPGAEGQAPGLATRDGGIVIAQDFLRDAVAQGDNPFVHEFSHLTQRIGEHDDTNQNFPADFPFAEDVQHQLESPEFQRFLVDLFFGGVPQDGPVHTGAEGWPTLVNLYRQFPEQLKAADPKIYRAMSEYFGYDPLTQTKTPPVQLNGTGSYAQALPALRESFDRIAGSDGKLNEEELRRALTDPSLDANAHAAIAYLLSNPVARYALDVGSRRGKVDDVISLADVDGLEAQLRAAGDWTGPTAGVDGAVDTRDEALKVLQRYEILADTADGRGGRDHHVSRSDLEALLRAPGIPPELRAAAEVLLRG